MQPIAGAHGELAGTLLIAAYHRDRGDTARDTILIPDSAHGTNPASAAIAGFKVVEVPSAPDGTLDVDAFKAKLNNTVAGVMLTCPNTHGLFEPRVHEIADLAHEAGALMYYDGANLNAIVGQCRPGDLGFDVMHFNLHKTFATPHGMGGPGSGPVGVGERLEPYLPGPRVVKRDDAYVLETPEKSIGRMSPFFGNFMVAVRAYAYIRHLGDEGLRDVSRYAVLHANYMLARLKDAYTPAFGDQWLHARVRVHRDAAGESGRTCSRHRQGIAGPRLSRADGVFPADREREHHDRAGRRRSRRKRSTRSATPCSRLPCRRRWTPIRFTPLRSTCRWDGWTKFVPQGNSVVRVCREFDVGGRIRPPCTP